MSESNKIREYDKPLYSQKDLWWAMTKLGAALFVLFNIYFRFVVVEEAQAKNARGQRNSKRNIPKRD